MSQSNFRNTIEHGGRFEPEKGRYILYVSYGCPWATRTLIARQLKGLEDTIPMVVLSPRMDDLGFPFAKVDPFPGAQDDPLYGSEHVRDIYLRADPTFSGKFSVPVLWDTKRATVVNNESSDIVRIFNTAFNDLLPEDKAVVDLYPDALRKDIDEVNGWVLSTVNAGVYKAGLATTQKAYEEATISLFKSLDRLEKMLADRDYLVGDQLTEADIRLFVTTIRFDVAYHGAFKCNLRTIRDGYPAINRWMRKLYWGNRAFSDTCDFAHIKALYYGKDRHGIVPLGPIPDVTPL